MLVISLTSFKNVSSSLSLAILSLTFLLAMSIASSEMSVAIISALLNSLDKDIAIAPDPVPISRIFKFLFLSFINFILSSIIPSVSGLGSKTDLST